jgi:hypothetical protein
MNARFSQSSFWRDRQTKWKGFGGNVTREPTEIGRNQQDQLPSRPPAESGFPSDDSPSWSPSSFGVFLKFAVAVGMYPAANLTQQFSRDTLSTE